MFAQMDSDGDGRITRSEFADRGQFDAIDGDGDGLISQTEAEGFQMERILRQRGGERSGGRRDRDR
jgi:Ca2+-binding EF-hand superfamily protein